MPDVFQSIDDIDADKQSMIVDRMEPRNLLKPGERQSVYDDLEIARAFVREELPNIVAG